eukprot:COSAG01_NODE_40467_length_463_cov_1.008242_2_plen_51_part_01
MSPRKSFTGDFRQQVMDVAPQGWSVRRGPMILGRTITDACPEYKCIHTLAL